MAHYLNITSKKSLFIILIFLSGFIAHAQDRIMELEKKLDSYSMEMPALTEKVDISVNGVSIQELLRGIANNVNLNLTIDPSIEAKIVNNFSQVRVADVLLYLCKEYRLDITRTGNILSIVKYSEPRSEIQKNQPRKKIVSYDDVYDLISIDASNDTLLSVVKEIINSSDKNIILSPGLNNLRVTGYLKNSPFEQGLSSFCYSNDLNFSKTEEGLYIIEKADKSASSADGKNNLTDKNRFKTGSTTKSDYPELAENPITTDSITLSVENKPILDILREMTRKTGVNYFLLSEIQGNASLTVKDVTFDEFLTYLLQGTDYTFKRSNNVYLIGDRKLEDLQCVKLIKLQYRTVTNIEDIIPKELTQKVDLFEFAEQNSVLLTGSMVDIEYLESFIKQIDQIVPVILIEVIIIDHSKKNTIQTGIKAGLGENINATNSTGTFLPGVDIEVGTQTLNELLNSLNGWGWVNLGNVTPNFYLSIKALEDNNLIKVRSTPKLATLNGHEANLVSGETKYYREEQNSYYGSQIPQLEKAYSWKAVNADLNIVIKPIVSGDDQVTLEIEVKQSEFTPREYEEAPPGSVTRTFKSMIRVKNNEMVLLGGLDRNISSATSSGVPFLARIPVIKWLFSSRTKAHEDSKLSLFIKPTIIY